MCVLGVSRLVDWSDQLDAAKVAEEMCIGLHQTMNDRLLCRGGEQKERKSKKKRDGQKEERDDGENIVQNYYREPSCVIICLRRSVVSQLLRPTEYTHGTSRTRSTLAMERRVCFAVCVRRTTDGMVGWLVSGQVVAVPSMLLLSVFLGEGLV